MFIRDDEMANVNTSVMFRAPSYKDEDYWAFQVFQKLVGEYTEDKYTGANLNATDRQYSTFHTHLGNLPDISIHKSFYFPMSDTGLFGSYLHGNEVHAPQMLFMSQLLTSDYSAHLNQAEVFRSRAAVWNDLLNEQSGSQVNKKLVDQVINLGRIIPRSEAAFRVSHVADMDHMKRVAGEWFWDVDVSAIAWGNLHSVQIYGHYNRPWKRSTLGWYGMSTYNVQ